MRARQRQSSVNRAKCSVENLPNGAGVCVRRRHCTASRTVASAGATMSEHCVHRHRSVRYHRPSATNLVSVPLVAKVNSLRVPCSANTQPYEQVIKSKDTQTIEEQSTGSYTHHVILDPSTWPAAIRGPRVTYVAASTHHYMKTWLLQKAWLAALMILVLVGSLVPPVGANTPPRFVLNGQSEIVIRLTEGEAAPVGSKIATLRGSDPDGDPLTFGVRGVEGRDLLRIEQNGANEANVYLRKALDREIKDEYTMVLTLTDNKLGEGQFITQSMLLLVEDINDNEPIFRPYESSVVVDENAPPRVLATLLATDQDEGPFGQVIYRLDADSESDAEKFTVNTLDGKGILRLVGDLDYERKSLYQLRVLAVDRAISGRVNTGTAALVVRVNDIEDQPPQFIQAPPVTRIPEDIPVNSGVLEVKAVDGDRGVNNPITYSILEGDKGLFQLDQKSGVLYVKKPLDRESPLSNNGAFIIKIQAQEESGVVDPPPTMTTEVTVLLEDVNDETPTFKAAHYIAEIAEGSQFNSPVNLIGDAIPEVYDHDQGNNGTFRMFLEGDDGMFDITPPEGVNFAAFLIRVRNPALLDYEKVKVVNFTVVARETVAERPKSSSALVTVHIRDTNDNFPIFNEDQYEVLIPEDAAVGATVAWVQARDPDSGNYGTQGIKYTDLRGALADKLEMNPDTGMITLKESGALDRESIAEHYLTVEARDDLGQGNRNTVVVKVMVEDVNDHPPVFLQRRYEARLLENSETFPEPFIISARDDDLNGTMNHEVRYTILSGDPRNNFTIHPLTGEIKPSAPLDFEAIDQERDIRYFNLTIKGQIQEYQNGGRGFQEAVGGGTCMDSRRKFTAMFKLRVIEYAEQTNNCAAAREFKVSEKSVRDWKKLSAQLKLLPKNKCVNRGKCNKWPQLEVEVAKYVSENRLTNTEGSRQQLSTTASKAQDISREYLREKKRGVGPKSGTEPRRGYCYRGLRLSRTGARSAGCGAGRGAASARDVQGADVFHHCFIADFWRSSMDMSKSDLPIRFISLFCGFKPPWFGSGAETSTFF
ncbi:cadherin-related family member 1-like [Homarus americanus]|uniref:cadherin-related family member 1-like n=1 Tax=Homarus americanus TaxID=6706 RepID=UPI001C447675|nr:cadherin-related family member 1-like [Homarus americanus]